MKTETLRSKLLFQYTALVLICMLVIPAFISWQMHRQFYKFSAEKLEEDKEQLITLIEKSLAAGDMRGSEFHGEMLRWPVVRFTVTDKNGAELFTVKHVPGRKPAPDQAERDKKVEEMLMAQKSPLGGQNGENIGTVTFYVLPFKMSREGRFLRVFQRNMYAGIAVMLLFAAAFAIYMTGKIVRPVLKTAERAKSISEGNYIEAKQESDIKELQTLLDSIDTLGSELAAQEALRKQLMSDIAHELRNPVTVVKGQLEAFADGVWEPTPERLSLAVSEIDRLSLLIKEVEGLSSLSRGGSNLSISTVNLSELAQKSAVSFEPMFKNKGVALELDIDEEVELALDAGRIRQVVENLVSNALRYTDKGGNVKIRVKRTEKSVILSVADTGIGIAKEELPRVFERFYRTDKSRARESGGMGIGLAIVKAIVEAHGAKITAESEEGKGSSFIVTFAKA